jgi:hypothetical protein
MAWNPAATWLSTALGSTAGPSLTSASSQIPDSAAPASRSYRIITFKTLVTVAWVGYQYLHDHALGGTR